MSELSIQLRSSLSAFHSNTFLPFLAKQQQDLTHLEQEFGESSEQCIDEVNVAEQNLHRLQSIQASQRSELALEEAKTKDMESQLAQVTVRAQTILPAQLTNLKKSMAVNESLNAALARDVATLSAMHTREIDAVTKGVQWFRERLGVKFHVLDGKLNIDFTQICREDPSKVFNIAIFVDENKEYQLHACNPAVSTIQSLVDELNRSNNFARFIGQVRKAFVQQAAQ